MDLSDVSFWRKEEEQEWKKREKCKKEEKYFLTAKSFFSNDSRQNVIRKFSNQLVDPP